MGVLFYVWAMLLIVTVIVEIATTDLTSLWFSIGAFVTLLLNLFIGDRFVWVQILVFALISILAIIFIRPIIKKKMFRNSKSTEVEQIIGKYAVVTSEISKNQKGTVKIHGVEWTACSKSEEEISAGEMVLVEEISGNKLFVSKI